MSKKKRRPKRSKKPLAREAPGAGSLGQFLVYGKVNKPAMKRELKTVVAVCKVADLAVEQLQDHCRTQAENHNDYHVASRYWEGYEAGARNTWHTVLAHCEDIRAFMAMMGDMGVRTK